MEDYGGKLDRSLRSFDALVLVFAVTIVQEKNDMAKQYLPPRLSVSFADPRLMELSPDRSRSTQTVGQNASAKHHERRVTLQVEGSGQIVST